MNITDKEALKELNRVKCYNLDEDIEDYPEDERDGRTDIQILADEVSYFVSNYSEGGHVLCEDLEEAKEILRRTKNGKVMPLWESTLTPVYRPRQIEQAKETVNEYRRLKNCLKRLNNKGIYGKWQ